MTGGAASVQLSVVIPTRARAESLAQCLEALPLGPDAATLEVIVTDDSDDVQTRDMVASRFPQVRWTAGPRRGPAANRNHGASLAQGEFIVFIDDDVVPSPAFLAGYRARIAPDVNVYEGRTTCEAGVRSPLETAPTNDTGGWLWSCNMMVRRSFWQTMGGFDEAFRFPNMEDVAFRERLRAMGETFVFVPAAAVDHPPRRLRDARARVRQDEAYFIYSYKYLGERPQRRNFVAHFGAHYLGIIARSPKSIDSIVMLGSLGLEIWGVLRRWREWDEQFRDLGANPVLPAKKDAARV